MTYLFGIAVALLLAVEAVALMAVGITLLNRALESCMRTTGIEDNRGQGPYAPVELGCIGCIFFCAIAIFPVLGVLYHMYGK